MPAKGILAASVGNTLEWYDFAVYAQFARFIAHNFFPAADDPSINLLKAFLVFGLGFVVRPLGALLIGNYADRAGRKAALTLTILLMAAGTAVIALCPTYKDIGIVAPLLLVFGRMLQGFSAGGEVGGAAAFLFESAAPGRRGRISAWLQASMGVSNILGALVAFTVTTCLTEGQLQGWGWRLPFLIGLLILPFGLYLRRSLHETEEFTAFAAQRRAERSTSSMPLSQLLSAHGKRVLSGFGVSVLWAVAIYVLLIYMPTFVQRTDTFGFTARQAFGASLIGNVLFVVSCIAFGVLCDRVGRRACLWASAALLLILVWPLFRWLEAQPTVLTLMLVQSSLCILVAGFAGVAPGALAENFPTAVRASGVSLVYNAAFTLFGGFAPAMLTFITHRSGGSVFAPAWYVMLAAVLSLLGIPYISSRGASTQNHHKQDIV